MRSTKQISRLTGVENIAGLRIDFGEEEVTNLASLQEAVVAQARDQSSSEEVYEGRGARPTVREIFFFISVEFVILNIRSII
jgi:hypothetical protein